MKKLLGAALALTMSITCAGALAACDSCGAENGGGNDAEMAKKAVNAVKSMYISEPVETPADYDVMGQVKVDGEMYTVNWSVTGNDIGEYIKVGDMNTETKKVTVSVTKAEEAIEYKLKASVTVGEATESVEFNRKVPAKPHESAGTLADPYTPSYAKDLASKLEIAERYAETDDIPLVYIRGYVVDCGQDSGTRAGFVYIADSYADDKGQNSTDAIMILSINYGDVLTKFGDLGKGDLITVSGFLMNYRKGGATGTGDPQPELTYKGSTGIQCHALVKAEDKRTDAEKVADALEGVNATMTVNKTGDTTLPVSEETDVTFSWALKSGDAATVADGKLTVTALPAEDKTVVVTVTASCGTVTETKDVTVTVKAAAEVGEGGTVTVNMTEYATANSWNVGNNGPANTVVNFDNGAVTATVKSTTGSYNNTGKYYENIKTGDGIGNWRLYQNENPELTFEAVAGYKIVSIKISYEVDKTGILTNADKSVNYDSNAVITVDANTVTFTVGNTGTATNGQVRITAIEVVYEKV